MNRSPLSRLRWGFALAVCALALPLGAAVPGQVDFQGLLLDAGGQKVNGAVDLVLTLYDAPTAGNALWTEIHADVQVADGVYGVTLGATSPLAPEILGGGTVYLQISVDGETLTPRRQLLAVPYALRAETAETAQNVGSVSSVFVEQTYQYADFDGNGFANADPIEGVGDVDGDGRSNFIDADNDDDTFDDATEVAGGTDPNLANPIVTAVTPDKIGETGPVLVTVTGNNFDEPGLAVSVGGQNPVPSSVTAASFQVLVQAQSPATSALVVTLGNGQSAQKPFFFARDITFFVTSTGYDAVLGGVAGADAKCAARAGAAGLSGTCIAQLSDGVIDPSTRLGVPLEQARFLDTLGNVIPSFGSGSDRDEFGNTVAVVSGAPRAWSGNLGSEHDCVDWTSNNPTFVGRSQSIPVSGPGVNDFCNTLNRLYCFEQ